MLPVCLFRFFSNLKSVGQNWHLKASCGKIPWIDAQCLFKSLPLKAFSQTSQVTFVCSILTWFCNLAEIGIFRWHISHWNFTIFWGFQIFILKGVFPRIFFSHRMEIELEFCFWKKYLKHVCFLHVFSDFSRIWKTLDKTDIWKHHAVKSHELSHDAFSNQFD